MSAALETSAASLSLPRDCWIESWRSPRSGAVLLRDGPHSIAADGERWPMIDGIAYLRLGREALVRAALEAIDAGDVVGAAALLLQDRAEADSGAPASLDALRALVVRRDTLSLREAMRGLGFAAEAEYFAHRWSDPTFLSGLALAEAHWPLPVRVLDVGCGIGQFLRVAEHHAAAVCGADLVFAHLWLARHFVVSAASLVCFDAAQPWPMQDDSADLVLLQDVLHLVEDRGAVAAEARRVAGAEAILCDQLRSLDDAAAFGPYAVYDDAELTAALVGRRLPRVGPPMRPVGAGIAIAAGSAAEAPARPVLGMLSTPVRGTALRRNPLYCEEDDGSCVLRFPSQAYADVVERLATYPARVTARNRVIAGADPSDDALIRRRVWLDLPARW